MHVSFLISEAAVRVTHLCRKGDLSLFVSLPVEPQFILFPSDNQMLKIIKEELKRVIHLGMGVSHSPGDTQEFTIISQDYTGSFEGDHVFYSLRSLHSRTAGNYSSLSLLRRWRLSWSFLVATGPFTERTGSFYMFQVLVFHYPK